MTTLHCTEQHPKLEQMKFLFIGHRGTGKSELASELKTFAAEQSIELEVFDLDKEIESQNGITIKEFWHKHGELKYRELELKTFNALQKIALARPQSSILVVGAGMGEKLPVDLVNCIDQKWEIVWVRRDTDSRGRVVLDRPALSALSPIEDYLSRFSERELKYTKSSHWALTMSEGNLPIQMPYIFELFFEDRSSKSFRKELLTLTLDNFTTFENALVFFKRMTRWGLQHFEVRDDLLTAREVDMMRACEVDLSLCLLSIRNGSMTDRSSEFGQVDVDFKYLREAESSTGAIDGLERHIISFHGQYADFNECQAAYFDCRKKGFVGIFKIALNIKSFSSLVEIESWVNEQSSVEFLPLSNNGKWNWWRSQNQGKVLSFVRLDRGSALDQTTILELLMREHCHSTRPEFAAVLGEPVKHSWSPTEHFSFFRQRGLSFYPIEISPEDFNIALPYLFKKGLVAASVTSPLKEPAGKWIDSEPLNTLALSAEGQIVGLNTDVLGLADQSEQFVGHISLWGGGGIVTSIVTLLPQALCYSARTGKLKQNARGETLPPDTLIWGVPRSMLEKGCRWPPKIWTPKLVLDLNYAEDSPGREYANLTRAKYVSGAEFFKRQAYHQRQFWSETLGLK